MTDFDITAASDSKLHRLHYLARLADDWDLFTAAGAELDTRTWDRVTRGASDG